ncbi:MAG: DUF4962 domain-containing protein [Alphaproteobacteria bacterium]|nr:DUF4962 domain-containing protein [Alphaproteobacteria bacterium]
MTARRNGRARLRGRHMLWLAGLALLPLGASADEAVPDAADPYLLLRGIDTVRPVLDWLTPAEPTMVQPYPANGALVKQSPPVIRWPHDGKMSVWEVALKLSDGRELHRIASKNWLFPEIALPPGRQAWRLRGWPKSGGATAWSAWRQFMVPRNAHAFVVPEFEGLFERASGKARPRIMPDGAAGRRLLLAIQSGGRHKGFETLRRRVDVSFLGQPLREEPPRATFQITDLYEKRRAGQDIARVVYHEAAAARFAAYVWIGSMDRRYLDEAMRRAGHLAAWHPRGSTGRHSADGISREIALTLATVYDLTHEYWAEADRARMLASIVTRTGDLFDHYIAGVRLPLARMPYNSHGFRHAGAIASIAALLAGDVAEARGWFLRTLPVYLAMNNPWGGDDGGFANSLEYAGWNLTAHLRFGDILEQATGLAPRRSAWQQEVGQYLRYFAPTGSPGNLFGDGHEHDRSANWRHLANIYAQRVSRPSYRQYARDWGPAVSNPAWVFAPLAAAYGAPATALLPAVPNAAYFPSIGWTAMHSDLDNPKRTSVYFLSSPYGSFNHSQAAQNSFVVHSRGRRLAISSGYYDFYGSDHHNQWSRQSKSKNAITYDGGRGQPINTMSARGRTVAFSDGADIDFVVGDAARAYGNGTRKALRTLAYLRPNVILVYDQVEANQPRRWEWNIHARNEMLHYRSNAIGISNWPASLCIEMIAGPATQFSQNDRFSAAPDEKIADYPAQWHGAFTTTAATRAAQFLALMTVDCAPTAIAGVTARKGGGYNLSLDGQDLVIDAMGARRQTGGGS